MSAATVPVGASPRSLAALDINADGLLDIAVANYADHEIAVLLSNGDGTMSSGEPLSTQGSPVRVLAAELNADGALDLIAVYRGLDQIRVFLSSDGGFLPPVTYASADGPVAVAACDFDTDSDTDVVVGNELDDTLRLFTNDGAGALTEYSVLSLDAELQGLVSVDLDGDAWPDLAVTIAYSNYDGVLLVLLNTGGAFASSGVYPAERQAVEISAADLDGNSNEDLVLCPQTGPKLYVSRSWRDGLLLTSTAVQAVAEPYSVAPCDLDADGDTDLVVTGHKNDQIAVLFNTTQPGAQDCDGNGIPDACQPDCDTNGHPDDCDVLAATAADCDTNGVLDLCDLDLDQQPDCNTNGLPDGCDSIPSGVLFPSMPLPLAPTPAFVRTGDLDGDGAPDAVIGRAWGYGNHLTTLHNHGNGRFTPLFELGAIGNDMHDAAICDLNGDDAIDVLAASTSSVAAFAVFLNTGHGTFHSPQLFEAHPGSAVAAADMDNDNLPDVIAGGGNALSVWLNDGLGVLTPVWYYEGADDASRILAFDADADTDQDILVYSSVYDDGPLQSHGTIQMFLNDGQGRLSPGQPLPLPISPRGIAAADLDGNGTFDLAIAAWQGPVIRKGLGDGTFGPEIMFWIETTSYDIAIADFDLDGDHDLATVTAAADSVILLYNNGDAEFSSTTEFGLDDATYADPTLITSDLDSDGDADILVTDGSQWSLISVMNATPHPPGTDCNTNAVLDECESDLPNCNQNGLPDECELADCNTNGLLDECDIAQGSAGDDDDDVAPDSCDICAGLFNPEQELWLQRRVEGENSGRYPAIAFDPNGRALVAYYHAGSLNLHLWNDANEDLTAQPAEISTLAGYGSQYNPMALVFDPTERAVLFYRHNGPMRMWRDSNRNLVRDDDETIDIPYSAQYPSPAFDSAGRATLAFRQSSQLDLMLWHDANADWLPDVAEIVTDSERGQRGRVRLAAL